jgi:hypothetical protein
MLNLGSLRVWQDPAIQGALSWYLEVAENRRPAKFRIAATLATDIDPAASTEEGLWGELDRLTPILLARWQAIRTVVEAQMAKLLVIGASRGIGLETVKAALRAGHSVRALARSGANIAIQNTGLEKVSGDALDRDTVRKALEDVDVVIQTHGVDFSLQAIFERTNLFSQSTRILVDAMQAAGV